MNSQNFTAPIKRAVNLLEPRRQTIHLFRVRLKHRLLRLHSVLRLRNAPRLRTALRLPAAPRLRGALKLRGVPRLRGTPGLRGALEKSLANSSIARSVACLASHLVSRLYKALMTRTLRRNFHSPATKSPVTDSPVADSPVADSPVADSPVADSPVADSPATDSPTTEAPHNGSPTNHFRQQALDLLSIYLREPLTTTSEILVKNVRFLDEIEHRRNTAHTKTELQQWRSSIHIARSQDYREQAAHDERSRIIASFHFGDFIYGLNALMCLEGPHRRRLVYSQAKGSDAYYHNMRHCFGGRALTHDAQLTAAEADPLGLAQSLRKGNCTLVMFCDLPPSYGETTAVEFLGREAWFPKSPALLALTTKTPLIPVINLKNRRQNHLRIVDAIEPFRRLDESLEAAVQRITQELIGLLEAYLRRQPEQWRYLQVMPIYFAKNTEPANTTNQQNNYQTRPQLLENTDDNGRPHSSHF